MHRLRDGAVTGAHDQRAEEGRGLEKEARLAPQGHGQLCCRQWWPKAGGSGDLDVKGAGHHHSCSQVTCKTQRQEPHWVSVSCHTQPTCCRLHTWNLCHSC